MRNVIPLMIYIMLCINSEVNSQQQNLLDSLISALPSAYRDTSDILLLNRIAIEYQNTDLDSSMIYARKSYVVSIQRSFRPGEFDALNCIATVDVYNARYSQALQVLDTAKKLLPFIKNSNSVTNYYSLLGVCCARMNDYPAALKWMLEVLYVRKKLGVDMKLANAYNNVAGVYEAMGEREHALQYFRSSLEIMLLLRDKDGIEDVLINIAIVQKELGDISEALRSARYALQISKSDGNTKMILRELNIIGDIYETQEDYKHAFIYRLKNYRLAKQMKSQEELARNTNALATNYYNQHKYGDAMVFALEAQKLNSVIDDKLDKAQNLNTLASIQLAVRQHNAALDNFYAALKLFEKIGDRTRTGRAYLNIGDVYIAQNNWLQAERFVQQAIGIAESQQGTRWLSDAYKTMSDIYSNTDRPQKAFEAYKKHISLRDSAVNLEHSRSIIEAQQIYERNKREALINANAEKREAIASAAYQWNQRIGIVVATALIMLISIIFFFRAKRQRYLFEQEQNMLRQKLISLKQEALNAQMSDHFIRHTIDKAKNMIEQNERQRAYNYLHVFNDLITGILKNASKAMIPLEDDLTMVSNFIELEKEQFEKGKLKFDITADPTIDLSNTLVPPMIFQVLAENSVHHGLRSKGEGSISINISKKGNLIEAEVKDNGIGRAASLQRKINPGSHNSYGIGIAEKLVKTMEAYGQRTYFKITDLIDEDNFPAGTTVTFTLPYILNF